MTKLIKKSALVLGIFAAAFSFSTFADNHGESESMMTIPVGSQGGTNAGMSLPTNGMKSEDVRASYGDPISWTDPVGEPPITTWQYDQFTVYFEYDRVIHSVLTN